MQSPNVIDDDRLQPYPHCREASRVEYITLKYVPLGPPPGTPVKVNVRHWCLRLPHEGHDHIIPASLTEVERIREASIPGWARGL